MFNNQYIGYGSKVDDWKSMAQYFENLRPYLGNMIDDLKASSK